MVTYKENKNDCQGKFLSFLGILSFFIASAATFVGSVFLIVRIPIPQNSFFFILVVIAICILLFGALMISPLIGLFVSSPIYKKAQEKLAIRKIFRFDKALNSLREYYGWTEPCIVTKCYNASDKAFSRRDICLFVVDDELRIAADLKHGFSVRENDPGCYSFKVDEFSLKQIQGEDFLITEFKSEDLFFYMGRRAKGFIEKTFISNRKDK